MADALANALVKVAMNEDRRRGKPAGANAQEKEER
jgi:hypothetical protein